MIQPSEPSMLSKELLQNPSYNPAAFLNTVILKLGLKSAAALSREINVIPATLSKVRSRKIPVGPALAIRIMEATGASMKDLYRWMGVQ